MVAKPPLALHLTKTGPATAKQSTDLPVFYKLAMWTTLANERFSRPLFQTAH